MNGMDSRNTAPARTLLGALLLLATVTPFASASASAAAAEPQPSVAAEMAPKPSHMDAGPANGPAIGGYSPVAYFTQDAAVLGSPEFAVRHDGRTYWLASAEEASTFAASPERYVPRFGAFCPYNLTLGRETPIDPTNFKIVADTLLLFHRSDDGRADGLVSWEASPVDERELLRRAEGQFRLLSF